MQNLSRLIEKLNPSCKNALEAAAGMCVSSTHYNVEIEHYVLKLLETMQNDLNGIIQAYAIDPEKLTQDLQHSLSRLKTGNAQTPALSQRIVDWLSEAWVVASLQGETMIRGAYLIYALVKQDNLARLAYGMSAEWEKLNADSLLADLAQVTANSVEQSVEQAQQTVTAKHTPALDQYTIDLTQQARDSQLDPILGRDLEIRQMIDILLRRRQNNPILTGEPGVGKTAVVEGLALKIIANEVPQPLQNVVIRILDLGLLQAGAGVKGEFENRLKSIIQEIRAATQPIILFIDEAHTLIGAGGQAGQADVANLLKPALARGELRTIAATTWGEYKKYFEQDAALTRRFQVIKIEEPAEETATAMLRGLVATLETHHGVWIEEQAVSEAVTLSHRYLAGRQLPDKAISVLDTACARVAMSQHSTPAPIELLQQQLATIQAEMDLLAREPNTNERNKVRSELLQQQKVDRQTELDQLQVRWQQEKQLVDRIQSLRKQLTQATEADDLKQQLATYQLQLSEQQGEHPLVYDCVDVRVVADIIAGWTGIPVGRMLRDEMRRVVQLPQQLAQRVTGQSHVLQCVTQRIQSATAKLTDPDKPMGVFLFVGPSGTGKTETALALAEQLYGGERQLTVINMSEFKEEHKVSMLLGSPPGYVGYGEGGVLTEAVRRKPYSLVLLDEMEKAHRGVQEVFYQVFDKGMLRDGQGRDIDFKNTVIIMTSNVCEQTISELCAKQRPDPEQLTTVLHEELIRYFKPAFIGRVSVVPFFPLDVDALQTIVTLKLQRICDRLREQYHVDCVYATSLLEALICPEQTRALGARYIDNQINQHLLPELANYCLQQIAANQPLSELTISYDQGKFVVLGN